MLQVIWVPAALWHTSGVKGQTGNRCSVMVTVKGESPESVTVALGNMHEVPVSTSMEYRQGNGMAYGHSGSQEITHICLLDTGEAGVTGPHLS